MPNHPTQPASAPQAEIRKAGLRIARFRAMLDWVLSLPAWSDAVEDAVRQLGIKTRRQGISHAAALRSLPIEKKHRIVRNILAQELDRPALAETARLARLCGLPFSTARRTFDKPSLKEWKQLQGKLALRLAARYSQYKSDQDKLFGTYYALPVTCVAKMVNQPALREDACQEARLALLAAIDRIDPQENFAAYARQWIERRLRNFVMRERLPVSAPINLISRALRQPSPQDAALANALRNGTLQFDDPLTDATRAGLDASDAPSPDLAAQHNDLKDAVDQALGSLTEKQRQVLELRFGLNQSPGGMTLAMVAQRTGISRQQVFQRERRGLEKLRELLANVQSECLHPAKSPQPAA